MTSLTSRQTSSVSQSFLRKLIGFYRPKKFTNESTQFDMGYEQAKRDLRAIVMSEVQDLREYENFEPDEQATPEKRLRKIGWPFA